MEWNTQKVLNFIEDYRRNDILWNIKNSNYRNIRMKIDVLNNLAEKYSTAINDVKKKIKNLRTAFHREHKVYKLKKGDTSPIKKPRWFAYEPLKFLLDVDKPRQELSAEEKVRSIELC